MRISKWDAAGGPCSWGLDSNPRGSTCPTHGNVRATWSCAPAPICFDTGGTKSAYLRCTICNSVCTSCCSCDSSCVALSTSTPAYYKCSSSGNTCSTSSCSYTYSTNPVMGYVTRTRTVTYDKQSGLFTIGVGMPWEARNKNLYSTPADHAHILPLRSDVVCV